MMSMIRTGRAAVPFEKIPVIARELEIDPALLLRLHLKEVWPEFGAVVDQVLGGVLTDQERKWIRFFEDAGLPEPPSSQKERDALAGLLPSGDWKEKQS